MSNQESSNHGFTVPELNIVELLLFKFAVAVRELKAPYIGPIGIYRPIFLPNRKGMRTIEVWVSDAESPSLWAQHPTLKTCETNLFGSWKG